VCRFKEDMLMLVGKAWQAALHSPAIRAGCVHASLRVHRQLLHVHFLM